MAALGAWGWPRVPLPARSRGACQRLRRAVPLPSRLGAVGSQLPTLRSPAAMSGHGERWPCGRSPRRREEGAAERPAAGPRSGSRREVPGTAPHAGGERRPRAEWAGPKAAEARLYGARFRPPWLGRAG